MGKANSSPRYARHRIAQTYESMGIIMLNEAVGIIDMTPFHDILQKLLNQRGADLRIDNSRQDRLSSGCAYP